MNKVLATLLILVAFMPCSYTAISYVWPLGLSNTLKVPLCILVLMSFPLHFLAQYPHTSLWDVPKPMLLLLSWWFCCILFLSILLLGFDFFISIIQRLRPFQIEHISRARMGVGPLSMLLSGLALAKGIALPQLKVVHITLPRLPSTFEGYRMVQLSDIHASRLLDRKWIEGMVKRTNQLNPDLIVMTGDIADGTVTDRLDDVEPLRYLHAKDGVYAVTGNHEYYFKLKEWTSAYANLGIQFLENQRVCLKRDRSSFWLAGVPDTEAIRYRRPGPNLSAVMNGLSPNEVIILLCHKPNTAPSNAKLGVSLQLSGHTHGGMVKGLSFLVKLANKGFVSGLYQVGNMLLYVSNGTGLWNGFPCRIGYPSEITLFILHSDQSYRPNKMAIE